MMPKQHGESTASRDAAIAAATVILEEFFPHCPNGIAHAIHERLCEIVEVAIDSGQALRWCDLTKPSQN